MGLLLLLALLVSTPDGLLILESPHYGARVSVDRQPVGRVPLKPLPLSAGLHLLEVESTGRSTWSRLVMIPTDGTVRVAVSLGPRRPRLRPPTVDDPQPQGPQLSGTTGLEWALHRGESDLELAWRWRLTTQPGPHWSTALGVRAYTKIVGQDDTLLRAVDVDHPRTLRLDEARVSWRDAWHLDLGRLLPLAPGGRALRLDGARAGYQTTDWGLQLLGGARAEPIGPPPNSFLLVGARGHHQWGGLRAHSAVFWHDRLHIDLGAKARLSNWRARLDLRWIGADLALADLAAHSQHPTWRVGARLTLRRPAAGPFERPLLSSTHARGSTLAHYDQATAHIERTVDRGWYGALITRARSGQTTIDNPDQLSARGSTGWRFAHASIGVSGHAAWFDPGDLGPAIYQQHHLHLRGGWQTGPLRIEIYGGWSRLELDTGQVDLPVGGTQMSWMLLDHWSVALSLDTRATHPSWLPDGGPLTTGRLEIRLR